MDPEGEIRMKRILAALMLGFLLLGGACGQGTGPESASPAESEREATISAAERLSLTSLPEDLSCSCFTLVGRTAFLSGIDPSGGVLYRVDTEMDICERAELPGEGPVQCLNSSGKGTCLAITYGARLNTVGDREGFFTLWELAETGQLLRKTELTGIGTVNLLAIGTPEAHGCALLGDRILVIVNNRLFLLEPDGTLTDWTVWKSARPKLFSGSGPSVCVADRQNGRPICRRVSATAEGKLQAEPLELPENAEGLIPSNAEETLCWTEGGTVHVTRMDTQRETDRWELPFGYSPDRDYCYDGSSFLLSCYHGAAAYFVIRRNGPSPE